MIFTDHLAIKDGAEDTSQMLMLGFFLNQVSSGKLNVYSPQNIKQVDCMETMVSGGLQVF